MTAHMRQRTSVLTRRAGTVDALKGRALPFLQHKKALEQIGVGALMERTGASPAQGHFCVTNWAK